MKLTGTARAPKHRVLTAAVTLALAAGAMPALAYEYTNGDFSFTTSNGVYGPGLVLTLTLTTPGELQQPVRVQLVSSGQNVAVELSTP